MRTSGRVTSESATSMSAKSKSGRGGPSARAAGAAG